jgi:hypothetical protein
MSNLTTIDTLALETVTGGTKSGDALLKDLSSLASSIKDLSAKTSGFSSTQMLLLVALAMRNQQPANVVYVGRPRFYW